VQADDWKPSDTNNKSEADVDHGKSNNKHNESDFIEKVSEAVQERKQLSTPSSSVGRRAGQPNTTGHWVKLAKDIASQPEFIPHQGCR